jgi:hypothetical protein
MSDTAKIIAINPNAARLECSLCGASTNAACECGAPYVPAGARAAAAVAADPEKSDRALATEVGVSKDTIRRARKSTGAREPVKRVGRDGKARKRPIKKQRRSADDFARDMAAKKKAETIATCMPGDIGPMLPPGVGQVITIAAPISDEPVTTTPMNPITSTWDVANIETRSKFLRDRMDAILAIACPSFPKRKRG